MRTIFKAMIAPAILSFTLIACDSNQQDHTDNDRSATPNSTTGSYPSTENDNDEIINRENIRSGWNRRMDEINRELEEIDRKIETEKSESKQAWQLRRSQLKEEKEQLEEKINRSGETSEKDWDQFKKDVDDDLDQLGRNVKDIFRNNDNDNTGKEQKSQGNQ